MKNSRCGDNMVKNKFIKKSFLVLAIFVLILLITGCKSKDIEIDFTDMHTVIYDGNGGFLGNKTARARKIKVYSLSKIPKYTTDYVNDPYVVSSLGKAMRDGYTLKGWYLEENASYEKNPNGKYIYLKLNENNGIYNLDENGQYVLRYVENEQGEYIFIYVEEAPDDSDPTTLEYVYFNGGEGFGFYLYDSDNAEHVEVYENDGSYKLEQLINYGNSYLVYTDLTDDEKEQFIDLPRYNHEFVPYNEMDKGLDRYSLGSGYTEIDAMMEPNNNGKYVYINGQYELYDKNNSDHKNITRFSIDVRYKFTPNEELSSPSKLTRYDATFIYWNFEENRVMKDITLKAHWVKKITVQYIEKTGQINEITTKLNENQTAQVELVQGELIGKREQIPQYFGYTFVGWSKSKTEYIPWDFSKDVFPAESDILKLYAFMIEGTYKRITTASDLLKVANDPTGNYVLCNDIDLSKSAPFINRTPLGFIIPTTEDGNRIPFSGKFISLGYKISNFKLQVQNSQKIINANKGIEVISGLFPYVQNATIEGLIVENAQVNIDTNKSKTNVICDLGSSGLIGIALDGSTLIKNCQVEITFESLGDNTLDCFVYVGDFIAKGIENTTIINSTSIIDYAKIEGITSDTKLIVSILN